MTGSVRYEDGSVIPASNYELKFVPQVESPDGVQFPRVGTAIVDSKGAFSAATTHKYQDGLIVGKQRVYLKIGRGPDGRPLVPPEYLASETSPLEVEVSRRGALELKVPRPPL
ncbi:hypothetical protein [Posidoniimonas polymericola]|uniref:hypothetical protein n=1 Tax=Posidoniimonas polymericola TaxID=2528002 RepID=UPI0011B45E87|nr:hypothetical protein [Posidoniimonas polymericola]